MKNSKQNVNKLTPKSTGLLIWGLLTIVTTSLYVLFQLPEYPKKALPLVWCFFSWNFYAYAFNKRMWPPEFVELHGKGKGDAGWRSFWFWLAAIVYALLLWAIASIN